MKTKEIAVKISEMSPKKQYWYFWNVLSTAERIAYALYISDEQPSFETKFENGFPQ